VVGEVGAGATGAVSLGAGGSGCGGAGSPSFGALSGAVRPGSEGSSCANPLEAAMTTPDAAHSSNLRIKAGLPTSSQRMAHRAVREAALANAPDSHDLPA
jgi:hypothetical protein